MVSFIPQPFYFREKSPKSIIVLTWSRCWALLENINQINKLFPHFCSTHFIDVLSSKCFNFVRNYLLFVCFLLQPSEIYLFQIYCPEICINSSHWSSHLCNSLNPLLFSLFGTKDLLRILIVDTLLFFLLRRQGSGPHKSAGTVQLQLLL